MPTKEAFSLVAGVLFVFAYVPYIRAIIQRVARPAKATWLIWALLDAVALVGMWLKGALNSQIVVATLGASTMAVLSLKLGSSGWTLLDKFCLCVAVGGVLLWQALGDPVVGIVASQAGIFAGAFPTFVSSWEDPSRENRAAWTLGWFSCVFTLMAIPSWGFASAPQPVVFFVIQSIMMYILYIRAHFLITANKEV